MSRIHLFQVFIEVKIFKLNTSNSPFTEKQVTEIGTICCKVLTESQRMA